MNLQRGAALLCAGIAATSLFAGFVSQDEQLGAAAWLESALSLLLLLALLFARRIPAAWLPLACLAGLVLVAATGVLSGVSSYLMIAGAAGALAAWDLVNLEAAMAGAPPSPATRRFEREHLVSLAAALGVGLLLAVTGRLISLEIPFIPLLLLVVLDLFALDRAYRRLAK